MALGCRRFTRLQEPTTLPGVKPPRRTPKTGPVLDRLEREGRIRPATADLRDVLARRGPLTGPITDAGTRALQEQRGDRG
ncbi:MAG: hypothetical protein JWR63_4623 [Conexibacter sp.]|nr:hypothetical protein [Conexibacter sp.]